MKSKPMWPSTFGCSASSVFIALRVASLARRCVAQVGRYEQLERTISKQLAELAGALQEQRTGHTPHAMTVVLSDDTLVGTLQDALTQAEKALAPNPDGAARVQEFHRQLFANSIDGMRKEITRITGRQVREAAADIETGTGSVVHAFATGAMVQVFLHTANGISTAEPVDHSLDSANAGTSPTPTMCSY